MFAGHSHYMYQTEHKFANESSWLPFNHGFPSTMELIWEDHKSCLPSIIGFS